MKAASLLGVLITAHVLVLAGSELPLSAWTPFAYLWQDVLVALVFAGLDILCGKRRWSWVLYGILVLYIAVNVPITLVLSSPLTISMIRATAAPLSDSITLYLTPRNVGAILSVIAVGIALPYALIRSRIRPRSTLVIPSVVVCVIGMLSVSKVQTLGLHRNAIGALWPAPMPTADGTPLADLRSSPVPQEASVLEDLSAYSGQAAGRNVVMIILESTGARYLRQYGATEDPTPHLTELANRSILFENAYAVYPESIKGLFSTLCSQYPGFRSNAEDYDAIPCSSMATSFQNAGYRTALFHSGRFMYLGMESVIENRGFEVLEDAGAIGGNIHSSFGVDEPATVQRMLSWIDSLSDSDRFFITYMPVAGHHPYASPERGPFNPADEIGRYQNALHSGDAALGVFLRELQSRGLYDKTLFIVFGDHAEAFGQHPGNFGHSLFIYDENVRVPYLIAAPSLVDKQIRVRRIASLIDTAPTLLDLLELPIPDNYAGTSLLKPDIQMALFFTDYSLGWLGLRDSCRKYIYEVDSRWSRLYDVCADPGETIDVARSNAKVVEQYRRIVLQWIQ